MIDALKALNVERIDLEQAVELKAAAAAQLAVYLGHEIPVPAWLTTASNALDEDIRRRQRDALKARQRELTSKLAGLRSREELRADLEAELTKVSNAIGDK